MRKFFFIFIELLFSVSITFAFPFNSNLSSEEKERLENGEVVIKNISSVSKMCLSSSSKNAEELLSDFKELKPIYLAEVIQIKPYEGNENLCDNLSDILSNVQGYVGIPYISSGGGLYNLYDSADIKSVSETENGETVIEVDLFMEPFETIPSTISYKKSEDSLLYKNTNSEEIYFKGFKALKKRKMLSEVVMFREDDYWIIYAAGGVDTVRVPFVETKVRNSFLNRIRTFCTFVINKLNE